MFPGVFARALTSKGVTSGYVYGLLLPLSPIASTPAEISNLILWLKADSLASYADTAALAQWDDSSGNANDLIQSNSANQP
jgi:hypothetical protein